MTNGFVLTMYGASLASGLLAACITAREIPAKLRASREPPPPAPEPPMLYNTWDPVLAALAAKTPGMTLADTRQALNELIDATRAESAARISADARLERLIGIEANGARLIWAVGAIVVSTICGGAGDIASTLGWNPFHS